ncbi:hypothetical protein Tco_0871770 [Tanacetum coccineum]
MILTTLSEDILMQVAQYETAKEVWESIKVRYIGEDRVQKARLQTLRRSELEYFEMKITNLHKRQSKKSWLTLKDKTLVRKLLNSVPKKFLPIVASIEQYSEIDEMSFEEAMGRIITFEERIKSQDEPEENYQKKLLIARSSHFARDAPNWQENDMERKKAHFILRLTMNQRIAVMKSKITVNKGNNNSGIRASNDPGKNKCRWRSKERNKKKDSKKRELKQQI